MVMDTGTRATKETIQETIRAATKETTKETIKEIIKATKATKATTTMATTITTNRDHLTNTQSLAILGLDPLVRSTMAVEVVLFAAEDSEVSLRKGIYHGHVDHMEHLLTYDVETNLLFST